ncbi:MAG: addiction module toxin RelE [Gammaproteobacteria bacterium]|nr:type II toxin-antitoxin system RelE/ParE family toxin [Beggiatoa alba]PCH59293.1 MAG: addiction module toxin RelE [Gammaproteobacteria bacterium]
MKIFVSNAAYGDLEGIKEYYEEEGVPHIGKQFITSIIEHVQTLVDNPDIGRVVPEFGEEGIRELIHSPFRIVYLRGQDSIHVIRVWRSERLLKLPENEI